MRILALDSSSLAASCTLLEDERPIGSFYIDAKLTHSQTLMPMVQDLFSCTHTTFSEVDVFAVSTGPGSFTGLRIGIAAVKGMAHALDKPCIGISTLEALAYNLLDFSGIACAVMDARRAQVYTGLYHLENNVIAPLQEDCAMEISALGALLKNQKKTVFLVGDGAQLCYNNFGDANILPVREVLRLQNATSVGLAALAKLRTGQLPCSAHALQPIYLRMPQAERELMEHLNAQNAAKHT